jgi:hypothetical protein
MLWHNAAAVAVSVDQPNHIARTSSSKWSCSPGTSSTSLAAATYGNQSRMVWRGTRVNRQ